MDLSLDRIICLLEKLGNPQKKIKNIIHIAGTNGKGSVLAYLSSILLSSGYTVDSYTSPHLVHFNERIKIGGNNYDSYIDDGSLADILHECERVNDGAPITIFELITAAAFLKYSTTNSDFLLLETGLGGRLDATNIIENPLVSVITPIGIDHQQFLGNKVQDIAREKAGIIKKNGKTVLGKQESLVLSVLKEYIQLLNNKSQIWNEDYNVIPQDKILYMRIHDIN
jgi:dihydrofolate synthase/folylpolyglutamate synthase